MPSQRRDYIMQQIDLLRQFVARVARTKEDAGLEDMLQLSFNLQEKLFGRPPVEFLRLAVPDQVAALMAGESKSAGHEKCLTYARLLKETAALYEFRGRDDLAFGARQLGLHVALTVGLDHPEQSESVHALVDELLPTKALDELHPPVKALLEEYAKL
ncbi:MAG TPA: hypothetical protein VFJ90_07915 [Candidatus Didemnitutus sp.]|nr:hypothetical protein [Candidatus Didemnitutus sp.]